MKSKLWKLYFVVLACGTAVGCGNSTPTVDFLNSIGKDTKTPKVPGTSNLTPTTELTGAGFKMKGRVSYIGLQKTISGANAKIIGKVSY